MGLVHHVRKRGRKKCKHDLPGLIYRLTNDIRRGSIWVCGYCREAFYFGQSSIDWTGDEFNHWMPWKEAPAERIPDFVKEFYK